MKILLVAATAAEIRPFLNHLVPSGEQKGRLRHFTLNKKPVDVLVTGVGIIPTAFCMGKCLPKGSYGMAVNAGICGSYRDDLVPGTVVEVTEDFPVELGAEEQGRFRDIFSLGLDRPGEWPFQDGKLVNMFPVLNAFTEKLIKVKGATVQTLGRNPEQLQLITDTFHPDIETMEGAAFLYSCLSERIPSIQLRAVSNPVPERDPAKWQTGLAVSRLNETLLEITG